MEDKILDAPAAKPEFPPVILWFHGIEGFTVALFIVSSVWKLMSWPGAGYMHLTCMGLWAVLTIMSPFYALKAYPDKPRTYIAWASLWVLALIYLGFLFSRMSWPFADEMRLIGAVPVWICGIYFARNISNFSKKSIESWLIKRMYYRMIPALFTSVIIIYQFLQGLAR